MKISNVGIVLLTSLVLIKYFILLNTASVDDGSFKNGVEIDRITAYNRLIDQKTTRSSQNLLAYNQTNVNQMNSFADSKTTNSKISDKNESHYSSQKKSTGSNKSDDLTIEPIPMDYGNTLVVYDLENPSNNTITATFEDIADDIPLDNGNTIVSSLMTIMPRR